MDLWTPAVFIDSTALDTSPSMPYYLSFSPRENRESRGSSEGGWEKEKNRVHRVSGLSGRGFGEVCVMSIPSACSLSSEQTVGSAVRSIRREGGPSLNLTLNSPLNY